MSGERSSTVEKVLIGMLFLSSRGFLIYSFFLKNNSPRKPIFLASKISQYT